jgi:energy-coupling factor transport system permease protein
MTYRRLASPLHAARAGAAGGWCVALAAVALATDHPLLLAVLGAIVVIAAVLAHASRVVARTMLFALPIAVLFALINPFVSRNGLTVFARLGELPPFGQIDLTVEALVYGLVFGLRVLVIVGAFALFSAAVDPDELLRLFRRVSPRSALTAVLATRMMPVLARDAARLDEARRCRADGGGDGPLARAAVLRAVATGSLDRALDVAATLEVRGYGAHGRPPRARQPWSRHDIGFASSGGLLAGACALVASGAVGSFDAYPRLEMSLGIEEVTLFALLFLAALLPFADRRGVER